MLTVNLNPGVVVPTSGGKIAFYPSIITLDFPGPYKLLAFAKRGTIGIGFDKSPCGSTPLDYPYLKSANEIVEHLSIQFDFTQPRDDIPFDKATLKAGVLRIQKKLNDLQESGHMLAAAHKYPVRDWDRDVNPSSGRYIVTEPEGGVSIIDTHAHTATYSHPSSSQTADINFRTDTFDGIVQALKAVHTPDIGYGSIVEHCHQLVRTYFATYIQNANPDAYGYVLDPDPERVRELTIP